MMMLKLQNTIDSFWSAWSTVERATLPAVTNAPRNWLSIETTVKKPHHGHIFWCLLWLPACHGMVHKL
jgi:hypothetical protein